ERAGEGFHEDIGAGRDQLTVEGELAEARRVGEGSESGEERPERVALGGPGSGEEVVAVEGDAGEIGAAALGRQREVDWNLLETVSLRALSDLQRDLMIDAEISERAVHRSRSGDARHVHGEIDAV